MQFLFYILCLKTLFLKNNTKQHKSTLRLRKTLVCNSLFIEKYAKNKQKTKKSKKNKEKHLTNTLKGDTM